MVDEMFDAAMDIADSEDSVLAYSSSSSSQQQSGTQASQSNVSGRSTVLLSELTASDRIVHADFRKNFNLDFFDDQDLE
ncbi:Hypothetical protein FKW44_000013 [Caligus rogercresseyi]|uniref:Uncharacterized protein n=1 Tax=Caligus rogercresseyi TaxID=217165 RepID=A0A7T8KGS4_CALRO|nr:Hypothetical protein FKW44_000013 [Caligus rogercresseyi]